MNLVYFIILIFAISIQKIFSQSICIIDDQDKIPVPHAIVTIYNNNNKIIFQQSTNDNGCVHLPEKISENQSVLLQIYALNYHLKQERMTLKSDVKIYIQKLSQSLNEIVITGEPMPINKQNSVQNIKVISEEKIQNMAAQNLKDVLQNENNIILSNDPILGTGMSLLGLSGQAVKILIDGVPVIGRLNGNIDISQINLNNVEKIEIVEGPLSVKYGTDAMGGVINIITKKSKNKKNAHKLYTYYESNGTYNINNSNLFNISKHQLNLSLGRNFFDGWNPNEKPFTFEKIKRADTTRYKLWKPREQYNIAISDEWKIKKNTLGLYTDLFNETITDRGKPFAPYFESAIDNTYKTHRNTQRITFNGSISAKYYIDFVAARTYYQRKKNTYFIDLTTLDKQLTTNSNDQDTTQYIMYMSRSSIARKLFSTHTAEWGYDTYYEKTQSSIIQNQSKEQTDIATFLTYSAVIKKILTIKSALRYSYNSLYITPLIPSVNILYVIKDIKKDSSTAITSSLRLSYAKGFRTPSLKELFLNFVDINHNIIGNPTLKPEISDFYNINFVYQQQNTNIKNTVEFNAFYSDVKNVITLGMLNTIQYSYMNIDRTKTIGSNIGYNMVYRTLTLSPKISFIGKQFIINHQSRFYFYPEYIFNLQYYQKNWQTGINVFSKYTGKMPYIKINPDNSTTLTLFPDYAWIDINLFKNLFKNKIQTTIGIKNLLNLTSINASTNSGAHASEQTLLGTGRTYFIQLILNLQK